MVLRLPTVLGYSIEANVLPSLAALQERLGLSEAELRKVVLRLPAVLGYSIEGNVLPSLAALQARLGLSEAELRKVVLGRPQVLARGAARACRRGAGASSSCRNRIHRALSRSASAQVLRKRQGWRQALQNAAPQRGAHAHHVTTFEGSLLPKLDYRT